MDITAIVLERALRGDPLPPAALTFLLRQYRATGRQDVCDALGDALARALVHHADDRTTCGTARWVEAFAEAATLSDDGRLVDAVRDLIARLVAEWPSIASVDDAAVSIDACLSAAHVSDPRELVPRAIDELERIVAAGYRPGAGVAHRIDTAHERGGLSDHVRLAAALLTAFAMTGRLPYSMLAEELMQAAITHFAHLRPGRSGTDVQVDGVHVDFVLGCEAARVLCRLSALHGDDEYRRAAVIRGDADYRADAGHVLARLSGRVAESGADIALYGLAFDEWQR